MTIFISYLLLSPNYLSVFSHLDPPPFFWELCTPEVLFTIFHSHFSHHLPFSAFAHQCQEGAQASQQGYPHTPYMCGYHQCSPQKLFLSTRGWAQEAGGLRRQVGSVKPHTPSGVEGTPGRQQVPAPAHCHVTDDSPGCVR